VPPFNAPISTTPTPVYTPNTSGKSSVFIQNIGSNTVYLGGSAVSTVGGLPVPSGESVSFAGATLPLFAASGFNASAALAGTTTAAAAQGGSVLSVASGGTVFTAGSQIVIEAGSARQEVQTVSASAAGSVTTSAPFAFAHGSASTFSGITPATTQLAISAGAV
jgi:hypothetical protein